MRTEVIVLAAGRGARLGDAGAEVPKWLLEVDGAPIADRQLDAIELARTAGQGEIAGVRVVTGHSADAIERYLAAREDRATTLFNPEFERLNNWYSVLLALRSRDPEVNSVAIINSDLFGAPDWLAAFFLAVLAAEGESLIAVDLERELTDESMKVSGRTSEQGITVVDSIGKVAVEDPVGEYVGMLAANGEALASFEAMLESYCARPDAANAWYEQAVGDTAAAGCEWEVWPTPGSDWIEIDDAADHAAAAAVAARL